MHIRYFHRKRSSPGTAPGTLIPDKDSVTPSLYIFAYDADRCVEEKLESIEQINDFYGSWPVIWLNVDGLGDTAVIQRIGEIFSLHALALEDTINTHQRPKTEDYGSNIYTVCRMANETPSGELDLEQVSIFVGANFVISFQEAPGDCWNPVRDRIRRSSNQRLRKAGPDYLAYCLLDAVIDGYFPLLEKFSDNTDTLEDEVLDRPDKTAMVDIQMSKRYLHTIRHTVWPLREAVAQLIAQDDLIQPETKIFLRDCQDHVIQLLDIVESYRERVSGLMDIYLSSLSIRLNEVMKVLAVITTIFMPLTFIAGVYGMNFNTASPWNMPELNMRYGYVVTIAVMAVIAVLMILYFIRLGWLSRPQK